MNDLHRAAATAVLAAAGPWGGHSNGNIPLSALTTLSWAPGHRLRSDAAAAFESLNQAYRARFGTSISITDSYRTLAAQQHLYETKGPGLAAVPGTSNHGWALAVDLGGGINSFGTAQHVWMVANGPAYGWIHPTWARQGGGREEAWHFEYDGNTTPTPPTEEDMPLTDTDIAKIWAYKNAAINGTRDVYGVVTDTRNQTAAVSRGGKDVSLRQEIADTKTAVLTLVSDIWGVKPTGTSTFGEMLMHIKMRLSNGTAPQAAGLSEVADLRKEMLAGFAEIKKSLSA
ncbi:M15 family metallopeptidase [Sanguibacter sp. 4.1]|uniref:M15 family metallopeptidase n=1 Tax=Sanguibacter biliveldensis TaxID=3030830 RepID=A0AAF0Z6T2_9MICO|nr:M15 family metallopeptidase [Sanguibacter sp. 4.1]WPF83199.1 M15 family metallopeptidase [Sanguibacter sp. 4.1]